MTSINRKCAVNPTLAIAALAAALTAVNTNTATAGEPCEPAWDTTIGQPGLNNSLANALTVYNGDLIAGGSFIAAGGQTVNHIARWDGSAWHPLTSGGEIGVSSAVWSLTVYNGDLIAGGFFNAAGGQTVNRIARWDGSTWHPFTSGGQVGMRGDFPAVGTLTVYDGDLIAGGRFETAGGQTVNNIARWDGTQWHPFESGGQTGIGGLEGGNGLEALIVFNGDLIVGGEIQTAGGQTVNGIARWDGSAWHPLVSGGQIGVDFHWVTSMTIYDGDLIVGGFFQTAGGQQASRIARWDGTEWHALTSGGQNGVDATVRAVTVYNGVLFVGGEFDTAGGQTMNQIARWNGFEWHPLSVCDQVGVTSNVQTLAAYDGDLIVAALSIYEANGIAAWQGCPFRGACCINGAAVQLFAEECQAAGGVFHGEGAPSDQVECEPACLADLNSDSVINVSDLLILLSAWGACP